MTETVASSSSSRKFRLHLAALCYFLSRLATVLFFFAVPAWYVKYGNLTWPWLAGGAWICAILIGSYYVTASPLHCAVCGAPSLLDGGQKKHPYAKRLLFMSQRARVAFDILFKSNYHCMYCHTRCRCKAGRDSVPATAATASLRGNVRPPVVAAMNPAAAFGGVFGQTESGNAVPPAPADMSPASVFGGGEKRNTGPVPGPVRPTTGPAPAPVRAVGPTVQSNGSAPRHWSTESAITAPTPGGLTSPVRVTEPVMPFCSAPDFRPPASRPEPPPAVTAASPVQNPFLVAAARLGTMATPTLPNLPPAIEPIVPQAPLGRTVPVPAHSSQSTDMSPNTRAITTPPFMQEFPFPSDADAQGNGQAPPWTLPNQDAPVRVVTPPPTMEQSPFLSPAVDATPVSPLRPPQHFAQRGSAPVQVAPVSAPSPAPAPVPPPSALSNRISLPALVKEGAARGPLPASFTAPVPPAEMMRPVQQEVPAPAAPVYDAQAVALPPLLQTTRNPALGTPSQFENYAPSTPAPAPAPQAMNYAPPAPAPAPQAVNYAPPAPAPQHENYAPPAPVAAPQAVNYAPPAPAPAPQAVNYAPPAPAPAPQAMNYAPPAPAPAPQYESYAPPAPAPQYDNYAPPAPTPAPQPANYAPPAPAPVAAAPVQQAAPVNQAPIVTEIVNVLASSQQQISDAFSGLIEKLQSALAHTAPVAQPPAGVTPPAPVPAPVAVELPAPVQHAYAAPAPQAPVAVAPPRLVTAPPSIALPEVYAPEPAYAMPAPAPVQPAVQVVVAPAPQPVAAPAPVMDQPGAPRRRFARPAAGSAQMQEILQQAFEAPAPTPAPVASVVPATQDYYAATPAPSMPAAPQTQMPLPPPPAQPWQAPSYAVTAPADNSQWNAASDLPTRRAPAAAVLPPSPMPVRAVQTSPFAIAGGDALDGQSPPWAVAH